MKRLAFYVIRSVKSGGAVLKVCAKTPDGLRLSTSDALKEAKKTLKSVKNYEAIPFYY